MAAVSSDSEALTNVSLGRSAVPPGVFLPLGCGKVCVQFRFGTWIP